MTRTEKKVWRILKDAGVNVPDEIRVERTYAGRNQRAQGWCVWIAKRMDGWILCGGDCAVRKLRPGNVDVYMVGHEMWVSRRGEIYTKSRDTTHGA